MKKNEDFQAWLNLTEDRVMDLKSDLPESLALSLDFSIKSLQDLEEYILSRFQTKEQLRVESEGSMILDRFARYFGEVARMNVNGCYWYIDATDKTNVYYNLPTIYVINPKYLVDSPLYVITTAVSRRTGALLTKLIENYQQYVVENGDKVPVFENLYRMPEYL